MSFFLVLCCLLMHLLNALLPEHRFCYVQDSTLSVSIDNTINNKFEYNEKKNLFTVFICNASDKYCTPRSSISLPRRLSVISVYDQ